MGLRFQSLPDQFTVDKRTRRLVVCSVIDNLVKGASGQAVQNMNLLFGLPETGDWNLTPYFLKK
jgi:N-acetyl-gamma-glutamyl-phosphate reductase